MKKPKEPNARLDHVLKWQAANPPRLQPAYLAHRARLSQTQAKYHRERKKIDPEFRLLLACRSRLKSAVRAQEARKHQKTIDLLGCDTAHLKRHLESLWKPGMSWKNHGKWHIDHIKPCSSFNLLIEEEQHRCFHWSNLQPLWRQDNHRKGDKWIGA